jgi:hypothetical protein
MMSDNQETKWHVSREISMGDLVAILTALIAVVVSYMQLDARVKVVEVITSQNSAQISTAVSEIKQDMRRIADRVERIVERQNGGK